MTVVRVGSGLSKLMLGFKWLIGACPLPSCSTPDVPTARFGVKQREALVAGLGYVPHLVLMTATPIPRTLALVRHGALLHSAIRGLPPGRSPITTRLVVGEDQRHQVSRGACYSGRQPGQALAAQQLCEHYLSTADCWSSIMMCFALMQNQSTYPMFQQQRPLLGHTVSTNPILAVLCAAPDVRPHAPGAG
jgi:hypothetical protein